MRVHSDTSACDTSTSAPRASVRMYVQRSGSVWSQIYSRSPSWQLSVRWVQRRVIAGMVDGTLFTACPTSGPDVVFDGRV